MGLKSAGLKSEKEAMHRMIDGGVFFFEKCRIFFDGSKFVFTYAGVKDYRGIDWPLWEGLTDWQVEVDWKESLSPDNPRWCKVWDKKNEEAFLYSPIDTYEGGATCSFSFSEMVDARWYYAEPVSEELAAMLDAEVWK